jgi:hypothetical protein
VVVGDVNGQFKAVFQKLGALHAKNNFAFAIIVGSLFGDAEDSDGAVSVDVQLLLDGKVEVPLPTYFALPRHPLPSAVVDKLESSNDELCHNLYFLGKRSVTKTSEGVRIVALGGQLDPNIIAGQSKDKYPPFYGDTDAKTLRGATKADILVTSEWPEDIRKRSRVEFKSEAEPQSQQCIADLDAVLKVPLLYVWRYLL